MQTTTIAAIATPPGEGGIGIIRISGPKAKTAALSFFKAKDELKPRVMVLGAWMEEGEDPQDRCMAVFFPAPRSYTGEDLVEIHAHGGTFHLRRILQSLLDGGLRPARPGEFTQRAFLNGKLDLTQAEAVADLISSKSELSRRAAARQLAGGLFARIEKMRQQVVDLSAQAEAAIDFPDEEGQHTTRQAQLNQVQALLEDMRGLLKTARTGRLVREGIRVAIVGRPNVGKSSLLNALLDCDRAIVAGIGGTTRDYLEESFQVEGFPIVLIDTAGQRDSKDEVENEGIRRSEAQMEQADLRLLVLDSSEALQKEDDALLKRCQNPRLVLCNKSDLGTKKWDSKKEWLEVSAKEKTGLEQVKRRILESSLGHRSASLLKQDLLTQTRHENSLKRAVESLIHVEQTLIRSDLGPEFVAGDLRDVLDSLGEMVGKTTRQEVLNAIFEKFCVGK